MDAQRSAAAAAFINQLSQHQGQPQPSAVIDAQQASALHHAAIMNAALGGNPFGIPTSAAHGDLNASQVAALQSLMGERAVAAMEQQQRNNLLG